MLHLTKNNIVTNVARQQVEIRQMEVDWYCSNYGSMAGQAAMLAGFAFTQLTTAMPQEHAPPFLLEFWYLFLTCTAVGLELSTIILSIHLSVWGPSLALRGKQGAADLHKAVDCLRDYQASVIIYFLSGWVIFFISQILQIWIYSKRRVAVVVTFPMSLFVFAVIWYSFDITRRLRIRDSQVVPGKIDAFEPYEFIGDIDSGLHTDAGMASQGQPDIGDNGYCPIHESMRDRYQTQMATN